MNKRLLRHLIRLVFAGLFYTGSALAATAIVPDDYATIQAAVSAVESDLDPGEVIINSSSIFDESVDIQESLTLKAGIGYSPAIRRDIGSFAPIRIRAMQDVNTIVVIEGVEIRTPSTSDADGIFITNLSTNHTLSVTVHDVFVDAAGSKSAIIVASAAINDDIFLTLTDSRLQIQGSSVGSPECVRLNPFAYNVTAILRNNTFRYSNASGVSIQGGRDDKSISTVIDANVFEGFSSAEGDGEYGIAIYGTGTSGSQASPTSTFVTNNMISNTKYSIDVNGQSEHTHTIYVNNNTIVNGINDGVALSAFGTSTIVATVFNNIIVGSGQYGIYRQVPSVGIINLTNDFNLLYDNTAGNYAGATAGANALIEDPLFANLADSNCRIKPLSPAIDSGNNAPAGGFGFGFDLDGNTRIQDNNNDTVAVVNRGAYEEPQNATSSSSNVGGSIGCFIFTAQQPI